MSLGSGPERRSVDRRTGDRRRTDRRQGLSSSSFDTWFNVWGDGARAAATPGAPASAAAAQPELAGTEQEDSPARQVGRLAGSDPGALARILRTYVAARGALGVALLLLPWVAALLVGGRLPWPILLVSLGYAGQAVALWLLQDAREAQAVPGRLLPRQWLATIGVDLLAFALLRLSDPAPQLNFTALLVLPVLMAGVLTSRVAALATAAGVTLLLLGSVWLDGAAGEGDVLLALSQAGLASAGMFLITLLASELALRLAGEERSARHSMELARQQAQLNRVVIEEMTEGVLVVDRSGRLRAINPAGRQLLGEAGALLDLPCLMANDPVLSGLHQTLEQAYALGHWPRTAREQVLPLAEGGAQAVQVRARFTRRRDIGADGTPLEDICVLFLEDLHAVRVRQRQDKLAAMGRVSAGIAHEIRNPLAAISQANALMLEDDLPEPQARLARIVSDNVSRLKRIVDDVMAVAPGADYQPMRVDASSEVARICQDWRRTVGMEDGPGQRLHVRLPSRPMTVLFDPEHLRRVLVNLLDNAARHASDAPGAVVVGLGMAKGSPMLRLSVASDGAPVAPDVERHLFEPFFSSRSRGSGLGLYICRELCERHGGSIDFRLAPPQARHRNLFSVLLQPAPPAGPVTATAQQARSGAAVGDASRPAHAPAAHDSQAILGTRVPQPPPIDTPP